MSRAAARALPLLLAIANGCFAWNGDAAALVAAPLVVALWSRARSHAAAFCVVVLYYLAASRGLLAGASVFFPDPDGARSLWTGLIVWIAPNALLAAAWAACWGSSHRWLRCLLALGLVSVPPIGIVGWANPLTAAGALFPGYAWLGLVMTAGLLAALAEPVACRWTPLLLPSIAAAYLFGASGATVPTPGRWVAIDTQLGSGRDEAAAVERMRRLQGMVLRASRQVPAGTVLVLPELVAGDWSIERHWWARVERELQRRRQTALIGAYREEEGGRTSVNALMSIGEYGGIEMTDRMPVPISMWRPWSDTGTRAYWLDSGVVHVGAVPVAHVICYEQLLVWPLLASVAHRPVLVIGAANDWWARGTSIPSIQRQAVTAWGSLFALPVVFAANE